MRFKKISGCFFAVALFLISGLCSSVAAVAETMAQAQAMAEKAVEFYKANGSEALFKAVAEDPQFKQGELYVYVLDKDAVIKAHGMQPELVGKDFSQVADVTGNYFASEIVKINSNGWVEYYWNNDATQKVEKKRVYVLKDNDFFFCVGIYIEE